MKDSINYFLQDNYAPLQKENYFENITSIIGEIPKELNGVLYRNGPNPQFPDSNKHWIEGDGMLHMFSIRNGKISYRNRWIMTEVFKLERQAEKMLHQCTIFFIYARFFHNKRLCTFPCASINF